MLEAANAQAELQEMDIQCRALLAGGDSSPSTALV
jgi:hypothetical protein